MRKQSNEKFLLSIKDKITFKLQCILIDTAYIYLCFI